MNLKEYFNIQKEILTSHIIKYLEIKGYWDKDLIFINDSTKKLEKFVTNGKMLRGIQVMLSFEMFGNIVSLKELNAAAAIELVHSALLTHDDIMDNDYTRRGNPTIFAQYLNDGNKANYSDYNLYGISQGISVGDIAIFMGNELLGMSTSDNEIFSKLNTFYSNELIRVGAAQMQDVFYGHDSFEQSTKDILTVYNYKSGRYSFSLPLVMGAILAHQTDETISNLEIFGEKLGIIFQIKDDEIGIFGDEETIKKPVGSDIRENKKTIFRSVLFSLLDESEREEMKLIFGNKNIELSDVKEVRSKLEKYKVLEIVSADIDKLVKDSVEIIKKLPVSSLYKDLLNQLVVFNLFRKS